MSAEKKIPNEQLIPIIDDILDSYINQETRFQFDSEMQAKALAVNKGLKLACESVIRAAEDVEALAEYTRNKIKEINAEGPQDVVIK